LAVNAVMVGACGRGSPVVPELPVELELLELELPELPELELLELELPVLPELDALLELVVPPELEAVPLLLVLLSLLLQPANASAATRIATRFMDASPD